MGFESLQGWRLYNLSGQSALMFDCPFGKGLSPSTLVLLPCCFPSALLYRSPLFPGWLPIGMGVGAAGKFPQNNPTSVLTQPPCQGECSSPTLVISFGLAPIYWFYWPKTRANTQAVVCLPELFHTKNYSSCLSPLHNQRLEKFQSSASPKSLK